HPGLPTMGKGMPGLVNVGGETPALGRGGVRIGGYLRHRIENGGGLIIGKGSKPPCNAGGDDHAGPFPLWCLRRRRARYIVRSTTLLGVPPRTRSNSEVRGVDGGGVGGADCRACSGRVCMSSSSGYQVNPRNAGKASSTSPANWCACSIVRPYTTAPAGETMG